MLLIYINLLAIFTVMLVKQFIETLNEEKLRLDYGQEPIPTSAYVILGARYLVRFACVGVLIWWNPLTLPTGHWRQYFTVLGIALVIEFIAFISEVLLRVIMRYKGNKDHQARMAEEIENSER